MKAESDRVFVHSPRTWTRTSKSATSTKIWHFSHIMPNSVIGDNCNIGQNVVVSPNCRIGSNVKIQNNVSVYTGVILEDDVFCGPFLRVHQRGQPTIAYPAQGTSIAPPSCNGARASAPMRPSCAEVTLGRYCFVGAGSVVTKDVPAFALVYGNPARASTDGRASAAGRPSSRVSGRRAHSASGATALPEIE